MQGNYAGLSFQLQREGENSLSQNFMNLFGTIHVEPDKAKILFPSQISTLLNDWKVGGVYRLEGQWKIFKNAEHSINFQGVLEGDNLALKGYRLDHLKGKIEYLPHLLHLESVTLEDAAGSLTSNEITLFKEENGRWKFSMPKMEVTKFSPSLLCEDSGSRSSNGSSLIVKELLLEGCEGCLDDLNTLIGKGYLRFHNQSKNRIQHPVLQIPSEIMSRIGLDPSLLIPITGTIEFQIENRKIYLTKFKDMYSEKKLSKFYLSSNSPSFMDFEGHLNLQVKMKQNNILFKLAELLTFNVGGDLRKPTYSLNKP